MHEGGVCVANNLHVTMLKQKNEALEIGTKQFEELEFCQLEQESSLEEKKETQSSQLLQERAEYHCSVARRKVGRKRKEKRRTYTCASD